MNNLNTFEVENNFKYNLNHEYKKEVQNLLIHHKEIYDKKYSDLSDSWKSEIDHQIGRYTIQMKIFEIIKNENIKGEILEFGSWQGQNLIFLANLRNEILNDEYKITGIDCFKGLPYEEDGWRKNLFNDTSRMIVLNNLKSKINNIKNIEVVEGYFIDKHVYEYTQQIENVSYVYFDSDLKTSTLESLNLMRKFFEKQKKIFIGFDDWGCKNYTLLGGFGKFIHTFSNLSFKIIGKTDYTIFFEVTNHNLT